MIDTKNKVVDTRKGTMSVIALIVLLSISFVLLYSPIYLKEGDKTLKTEDKSTEKTIKQSNYHLDYDINNLLV